MVEGLKKKILLMARGVNPLWAVWCLFGSLRWAIALIIFLVAVSLAGVFLPQIPEAVRGDQVGEMQWVALQNGKFGPFTNWMHRVGLFDVFRSHWFAVFLGLLAVSSAVYVLRCFPAVWWSITKPHTRVPDRYFEVSPHRAVYSSSANRDEDLERVFRRRLYRVERYEDGESIYLFADRFRWAEVGTLLTHVAVVVFVIAAVVSSVGEFNRDILIAEGESAPVFEEVSNPNQMQIQVLDSIGRFDTQGNPLDYRSELVIFQGGQQVKRCITTVNSPCSYDGYRFLQAAYFGFGAELQVRDLAGGNVIYHETLALADTVPSPHLTIYDASSALLFDNIIIPTERVEGIYGKLITVADNDRSLWVGSQQNRKGDWVMLVLAPAVSGEEIALVIPEGQERQAAGLTFQFNNLSLTPASMEPGFPLPPSLIEKNGTIFAELTGVVYGSGNASSGSSLEVPEGQDPPLLIIVGLTHQPLRLLEGEGANIDGYEYKFLGQREFSGIEVKKDRSDNFIWSAAAMLLVGLLITFWVPRRRIWAKITGGRVYMAGKGGHITGFQREVKKIVKETGAYNLLFQVDPRQVREDV